eukprot:7198658-Alexandrium_andersonii.AAC.1
MAVSQAPRVGAGGAAIRVVLPAELGAGGAALRVSPPGPRTDRIMGCRLPRSSGLGEGLSLIHI